MSVVVDELADEFKLIGGGDNKKKPGRDNNFMNF